jgi:hypothetical protein
MLEENSQIQPCRNPITQIEAFRPLGRRFPERIYYLILCPVIGTLPGQNLKQNRFGYLKLRLRIYLGFGFWDL